MKMYRLFTIALFGFIALFLAPAAQAQTPAEETAPADTMASALLNEFDMEYDIVFKAVRTGLESIGYQINYASKKRNTIETSFKTLTNEAQDNFNEVMPEYGEIPYMRSPGWTVGRNRVLVTFEQLESGKVGVKVVAMLSGYEDRFTNRWHYWGSNGKLEQLAMEAIVSAVDSAAKSAQAPVE